MLVGVIHLSIKTAREMKTAPQIIRDETSKMAYVITLIESTGVGLKLSFRSYSIALECGGYETTVNVFGATTAHAAAFCGNKNEIKANAKVFGFQVVSLKINNIVSEKNSFNSVKNQF